MRGHFGSRWEQQVGMLRLLFEKAMAHATADVEVDAMETESQQKGKGGIRLGLKGTTEHFETKYLEAVDAESQVRKALAIDDDIEMMADPEALARKTFMDSMGPEAHDNTVLATDFDHPNTFENPELTEALRKMAISDDSSWEDFDRYTEPALMGARSGPRYGAASTRSQSPRAPEQQGYRGGAGLGRGVPPQRFQPATTTPQPTKPLEIQQTKEEGTSMWCPCRRASRTWTKTPRDWASTCQRRSSGTYSCTLARACSTASLSSASLRPTQCRKPGKP